MLHTLVGRGSASLAVAVALPWVGNPIICHREASLSRYRNEGEMEIHQSEVRVSLAVQIEEKRKSASEG